MSNPIAVLAIAIGSAVALVVAPTAGAVNRTIALSANGSGTCQGALPNFEGLLRKRPLAIQNEGTAGAYVTCSPPVFLGMASPLGFGVAVANYGATTATITCTGVDGFAFSANATYVTKSVVLPPGTNNLIDFFGVPFDNENPPSASCLLPPGTGVNRLYTYQTLDVGA